MSDHDDQIDLVWRELIANASAGEGVTRRSAERIVDALAQPAEVTDELRAAAQEVVDVAPAGSVRYAKALARLRAALETPS